VGRRLDGDGSSLARSLPQVINHYPLERRIGKASHWLAGASSSTSLFLTSCPLACCCHLHLYFRPCDAWFLREARPDIDVSTISSIFFIFFSHFIFHLLGLRTRPLFVWSWPRLLIQILSFRRSSLPCFCLFRCFLLPCVCVGSLAAACRGIEKAG